VRSAEVKGMIYRLFQALSCLWSPSSTILCIVANNLVCSSYVEPLAICTIVTNAIGDCVVGEGEYTVESTSLNQTTLSVVESTIIDCVISTTQTYVEALKKQGKFDADAQKIAFTKTYTNVMAILNKDAKKYLEEAIGDLETYVYNKIEAEVNLTK
jgi:hypothetical protein